MATDCGGESEVWDAYRKQQQRGSAESWCDLLYYVMPLPRRGDLEQGTAAAMLHNSPVGDLLYSCLIYTATVLPARLLICLWVVQAAY